MLISASILLVSSPHIALVVSIFSLVVPTYSLVWHEIIPSSWCGNINLRLCIAVCVGGGRVSAMISPLLIFCTYKCAIVIVYFLFARWLHYYVCVHYWYCLFTIHLMTLKVSIRTYSRSLLNTNIDILRFYFRFMLK